MADYNGYKIKRTHSLTPLTSVFEAESAQGQPGRFALKVFHPPASTNVRRTYAIEGWLLAAEHQQQSAKKDGSVLEVLTYGRCEEGAFAVYPWQEHFLEPWIKALHPKGNTLRALAECLLNTIEQWEKETGGPHGNLKPANVFLDRTGPLVGMTAKLSDPAFLPGATTEQRRVADFNAIGTMLATIVRRRLPGAWPIEEAPEWKALGHPGKAWLDFCNYLLNPQPGEGEVTLAQARLRLKKIPKDANPVKTAALSLAAVLVLGAVSVVAFARFGNFIYMPEQLQRLALTLKNPTVPKEVPKEWADLCAAWDTWLVDLQGNAGRLLRTEGLLEPGDPLREALADFMTRAKDLRPEALVPEAASEKRLGVLGNTPPDAVFNELLITAVRERVTAAGKTISSLNVNLENWARWDQLRALQKLMADREYTRVAGALATRLPPARGSAEFGKQNVVRTLKFFNDLSLDTGALPLASRWSEISRLSGEMEESRDRIQMAMPEIILRRLQDMSSIADFADSLVNPLEEMRQRRKQFLDPQVVRDRFLKESELQTGSANVEAEDIGRWEQELFAFSLVPAAEDPRRAPAATAAAIDATAGRMTQEAVDLEREAPQGETGQPATLSTDDFKREYDGLNANLQSLRTRTIVRRDLPKVTEETSAMEAVFKLLYDRLTYTLSLLKPETWLAKVALPYGTFSESKQRWETWSATVRNLPPDSLRGAANRPQFRRLRENERTLKEWIDGLEGPAGFGALKAPELAPPITPDTAAELKRLEAVRREKAAADVGAATTWTNALPAPAWAAANAAMRAPIEQHSLWLGQLPDFARNLDELSRLLAAGFAWDEGVNELMTLLNPRPGLDELTGIPAGWTAEARELRKLTEPGDRATFTTAAQGGGLSRKLMAWRKLGALADWPASPAEFDTDVALITRMRELVRSGVKDEARRTSLFGEMMQGMKARFNRAAMFAARAENLLTDMFNRLTGAGLTEADLEPRVATNLEIWRLKHADWNEKDLNRLGARRDAFVRKVRAIGGGSLAAQGGLADFLGNLDAIELKDIPNRVPTPSPVLKGWEEVVEDEGLTLIATWKNGSRNVRLEYRIVQPLDDTPPFFLAKRAVAVGEFLDLLAGRPKDAEVVLKEMPSWGQPSASDKSTSDKPWNLPVAWRLRSDLRGLELSPTWIHSPDAMVQGILENTELRAANPALELAATEKPTLRTPLQQVTPKAAKLFAENVLGARLPTPKEWQAVLQATKATAAGGHFRGPVFEQLFTLARNFEVRVSNNSEPLKTRWRPSAGSYFPTKAAEDSDPGQAGATTDTSRLWFRPVDEGPKSEEFVNLLGNVSIFLAGDKPNEFFVAGGSVLSPPGVDFTQPQKVGAGSTMIGGRAGSQPYSDVGLRPAFDAPPGFKERFTLLRLVRGQKYLTL